MLVTIALSDIGRFTADIGEDDATPEVAIGCAYDMIFQNALIWGKWGGRDTFSHKSRKMFAARFNVAHVVSIYTEDD